MGILLLEYFSNYKGLWYSDPWDVTLQAFL